MTFYLRQSTANQKIPLGYFVDSVDGNTEESSLTIAASDIKLWKPTATTLVSKNLGGATIMSNGVYYAVLDAVDTATTGSMKLYIHMAGARPVEMECVVLPANVYDSLISGGDLLDVFVQSASVSSSGLTATSITSSGVLIIRRSTTFAPVISDTDLTDYVNLWFTAKVNTNLEDRESLIQISLADGLIYINKTVAVTPADGSLTVVGTDIHITLIDVETIKLSPYNGVLWDIKKIDSGDVTSIIASGTMNIQPVVTLSNT